MIFVIVKQTQYNVISFIRQGYKNSHVINIAIFQKKRNVLKKNMKELNIRTCLMRKKRKIMFDNLL